MVMLLGAFCFDDCTVLIVRVCVADFLSCVCPYRRLMAGVVHGLQWIHGRGMVHMDLKPANIMVAAYSGRRVKLKITDFGLAGCEHNIVDRWGFLVLPQPIVRIRSKAKPSHATPPRSCSYFGRVLYHIFAQTYLTQSRVGGLWTDCNSGLSGLVNQETGRESERVECTWHPAMFSAYLLTD